MFILSFITSPLKFRSVNHIQMYQNSELKTFQKIKFVGELSSN